MKMEMPKLTPQHEKLRALVGLWKGDEKLHPSPWDPVGGPAKGFSEGRVELDGMWVTVDYRQEREGQVTYRGHGVFGWDQGQGTYNMYWFDSMGTDPGGPARGKFEGDTLMFEMKTPMGHSRYAYKFQGSDRFTFTIAMSQDGRTWTPWLDSSWVRA